MRTIQRTYTLFTVSELKDADFQKAYEDWLVKGSSYPYADENRDTLRNFCNLFRIVCTNYHYDSCTYHYRFHTDQEEDTEQLSGIRLLAYLHNHFHSGIFIPKTYWTGNLGKKRRSRIFVISECPFTGYVMDDIILRPLLEFMQVPDSRTFKQLMRDCLEAFFRSCRDDCEYYGSEEHFRNESRQKNWEYLADGTFFRETA